MNKAERNFSRLVLGIAITSGLYFLAVGILYALELGVPVEIAIGIDLLIAAQVGGAVYWGWKGLQPKVPETGRKRANLVRE